MYLLAFVSTERLFAVWCPHSFTLSTKRAKIALCVIAAFAVPCSVVMAISRTYPEYVQMGRFFTMSVTLISVIVMVVCYTLVAVKMLVKLSAPRKKVGVLNTTRMTTPDTTPRTNDIRVWRPDRITQPNSASAKVAKTYKGVSLLLIITAVCDACWVPQLMSYVSMSIPPHVRGLSLLNSAANPLIYSIAGSMFRNDAKLFYRDAYHKLTQCFI